MTVALRTFKKFQSAGLAAVAVMSLCATMIVGQTVSSAAVQPHVAFSLSADTRYDHAVRITVTGLAASGTTTFNLICDGTHASSNECTGGAQGVYSTFTKNGSNQWVRTGTNYYATVASPVLWFGGLANNQSYTLTFTQNSITSSPVTFTPGSSFGGPTNVRVTLQATPEASVPTVCPDMCASAMYPETQTSPSGSTVTVSWTKPAAGMIEGNQGLYASNALTPEGYIVTVLPTRTKPFLYKDNASLGTNTFAATDNLLALSNGSTLYDGCVSVNTSANGGMATYGKSPTVKMGAIGLSWYVDGFDTTSAVLKGCHFARDESYVAYVEPYYTRGYGAVWASLDPNKVPYGWDTTNKIFPLYESYVGNADEASLGGGGEMTLLQANQPWQTGASAVMTTDGTSGNLVANPAPVTDILAQPVSTTDPSLNGALRVSWTAATSDLFYGTPDPTLAMSAIVQYRVTVIGYGGSWEANAGLYHLNETPKKATCVTSKTTCDFPGLSEWTTYSVSVQAENSKSRSLILTFGSGKTNWPLSPSEPLNPVATSPTLSTTTISWDAPTSVGGPAGATITKYTAYMYPRLSTVANDCAGNIASTVSQPSVQLFQLQTTTKEIVGAFYHDNGSPTGSIGPSKLSYFGRNTSGVIMCLGSTTIGNTYALNFNGFNPTTNGYILKRGIDAYYYAPKIADDDPRLVSNYGGTVSANINPSGAPYFASFMLFPGGPDFSAMILLGNSASTAWAATGAVLEDVRQLSNDASTFLALVGSPNTQNRTTSKWYRMTVSGGVVTRESTPVISLGCLSVASAYCSTTVAPPTPGRTVYPVLNFAINPVSGNIYFSLPAVNGGNYTSSNISPVFYRMSYDATSATWGAPTSISFENMGTPSTQYSGEFPIGFRADGKAYLTTYFWVNGGYRVGSMYTESSSGFALVPMSNLLGATPYRSPAFPAPTSNASRVGWQVIFTTFDHVFGLDALTLTNNEIQVRISYSGDMYLHVCTSTDGPPATPSCTMGTGSDPHPIVPGTAYSFDVTATNTSPDGSIKNGPLSKIGSFFSGGPAAPTLTNLQLGGTLASPTATATFRPSIVSPGAVDSSITSYACTLYSSTGAVLATKTVTPPSPITLTTDLTCNFTAADGLANTKSYSVGITATNAVGTSAAATAPLLIVGTPVAPAPVSGSTTGSVTTVTYTPNSTGTQSVLIIDPVTGIEVPGATCVGATINSPTCTVNGLTPGKTYTLKACTANAYAVSPACTTSSYTVPYQVPDKPVVTTNPADGKITVNWPTPPGNGSVITGYTVNVSPGGGTGCTGLTASSTSCELTGLTNGTTYDIEVVVNYTTNGVAGTSKVATTVSEVPFVAPAVPEAPTAVANGSESATVTYTPTNDNGTTVSSYTFYAYTENGNIISPNLTCTAFAPATSCDVTGLTEGVTYKFGVVANFQGQSGGFTSTAMSPLSNPVTPTGVVYAPDAPTNVTATGDDHAAQVSWTAPASDGGSPVTGYTVTAYDSNGNAVGSCTATAPTTTCLVEGLALGQSYTFAVVATNVAGDSTPSDASTPVQPTGVDPTKPGPILNGTATPGDGHVTVTWTAPDTGDVPTSYEVSVPGFPTCVIDLVANPSAALSCDFAGLTNGTEYTFTIVAKNAQGSSTTVDVNGTPATTPGVVTSGAATGGDTQVVVSWAAPASDGSATVTSYTVSIPGQPDCVVDLVANPGAALSCTFTGLTNGTNYTATIVATNAQGNSSGVTVNATPHGTPGPVQSAAATGGDTTVSVTWSAPTSGDVVTSYVVSVPGQPDCVVDLVANPSAALSCTFTGLTNGTSYTATIVAKNGSNTSSTVTVSATPYGTPAVPSVTTVVSSPSGTGALVTFTHPSNTGGGSVTGYTVTAYDANGNVVGSCTTTATSCIITGLTKGSTYSFKAQMNTTHGNSAQSAPKSLLIPSGYQKVNAYIRGWSYAQRDISDGMRKAIGAAARAIVAGNNKTVTVTGFANFTALKTLSYDRAVNVAAYLRHELNRFGGRSITIKVVNGGCTTKFGGTVLNRVAVIQGR